MARVDALAAETVAVVGYGNQGRSWALNLRDWASTRRSACAGTNAAARSRGDGFAAADLEAANDAST